MSAKWVMLALAFCGSANATTVFGIKLGARLDVPECHYSRIGGVVFFDGADRQSCYQIISVRNRTLVRPDDMVAISLASDGTFVAGDLHAQLVNGSVQRMWCHTAGVRYQESDMQSLVAKFGRPTHFNRVPLQNAMGASFQTDMAAWSLPNGVRAVYMAAVSRLDRGRFEISTIPGRAYLMAHEKSAAPNSGL